MVGFRSPLKGIDLKVWKLDLWKLRYHESEDVSDVYLWLKLEASKTRLEELELQILTKEKKILLLKIETQEAKEQLEREKLVFCETKKSGIKYR